MKSRYVTDLAEGEQIEEEFLVAEKSLATTRAGKPYLRLRLMDRTGDLDAKVWDNAEALDAAFDVHDCVRVRGRTEIYNERLQLSVDGLTRLEPGSFRLGDFLPRTEQDPKEMLEAFRGLVEGMENAHLRALLLSFLDDPELSRAFMTAPAAQYIHHAWLGGLLEHVLSLSKLITTIAPLYPQVDWELVLTGAFLHDLGKTRELYYQGPFTYTDEGQLIGHLTMGVLLVHDRIREFGDFPPELELQVKHLIVGHHGRLEFGSPKLPQTIEAVALSMLDDFDSKMNGIDVWTRQSKGSWSPFHRAYGRAFYRAKPSDEDAES